MDEKKMVWNSNSEIKYTTGFSLTINNRDFIIHFGQEVGQTEEAIVMNAVSSVAIPKVAVAGLIDMLQQAMAAEMNAVSGAPAEAPASVTIVNDNPAATEGPAKSKFSFFK